MYICEWLNYGVGMRIFVEVFRGRFESVGSGWSYFVEIQVGLQSKSRNVFVIEFMCFYDKNICFYENTNHACEFLLYPPIK